MMKLFQSLKRKNRQKGNALVMVIIAIAFIGMLVAMIVYSAYGNFLMKFNDFRSKDNFYSAEAVLDVINAGMQVDISDCMLDAYTFATSASETEISPYGDREDAFREKFAASFKDKVQTSPTVDTWKVQYFRDKFTHGAPAGMSLAASAGAKGAFIDVGTDAVLATPNVIATSNNIITFKNLRVTYTNDNGYVSIIQTDIRVMIPEMKTVNPPKNITLHEFCLIADRNIYSDLSYVDPVDATYNGGPQLLTIGGNVNAGKKGLVVGEGSLVKFLPVVGEVGNPEYTLVSKDIEVHDTDTAHGLRISSDYQTFASDLKIKSATAEFDGTSYVGDDLDIGGKDSVVTLKGHYIGYGNDNMNSGGSSSILINGANTTLDMGGLKDLLLAGNTFIGATSYDADTRRYDTVYGAGKSNDDDEILDIDSYKKELDDAHLPDPAEGSDVVTYNGSSYRIVPENTTDLIMGGSMGAKAEQMLYLIPPECVGYIHNSTEAFLNKNPLTRAEYEMLINDKDDEGNQKYDLLNIAKLDSMGYTNNYKAIYRRVNGTVMVYLYIDFANNEVDAANFMRACYVRDKDTLDTYISPYYNKTNSRMGADLMLLNGTDYPNISVQGNLFYYDAAGELQLIRSNIGDSASKLERATNLSEQLVPEFHSRLYTNKTDETPAIKSVFQNTMNVAKINALGTTTMYDYIWSGTAGSYTTMASTDYKAVVHKGDYVWDGSKDPKIKIVIATGNIYVEKDFDGLMISGGDIVVGKTCNAINRNLTVVKTALRNLSVENTSTIAEGQGFKLSDLFIDTVGAEGGGSEASSAAMSEEEKEEDSNRSLGKYITYDNWRKE